jgi:hypothetical protein
MKGLIIQSPWIDLILQGQKIWEIRSRNSTKREKIALIKSGTGLILGTVDLVNSKKLTLQEFQETEKFHCIGKEKSIILPYKNIYAWEFQNPIFFDKPIPYIHPQGAVIWVDLQDII